jgi:hypothetical protein
MRVGLDIREIVDGDDIDVIGVELHNRSESQASDAPKSVDSNLDRHK